MSPFKWVRQRLVMLLLHDYGPWEVGTPCKWCGEHGGATGWAHDMFMEAAWPDPEHLRVFQERNASIVERGFVLLHTEPQPADAQ